MKWIFLLMVMGNIGFAVWQTRFAPPAVAPSSATAQPAIPAHVNRLLLLGELEEERLRERVAAVAPADEAAGKTREQSGVATAAVAAAPANICFRIGPLASEEEVSRVGTWLRQLGSEPVLREDERREVSKFWVYFPPFPTRKAALQRVEQMVADQVDDIYVIPRGDQANAVSLGLYAHRASLERRLQELSAKGYEPSTVPRYESKKSSWYDVQFEAGFAFPAPAFLEAFPETEASETRCG